MCDASLSSVHPSDYEKMPAVIESEDPLFNVGKKELRDALRMAYEAPWVADWLFAHTANIFHPQTASLPPEAFDNSLAIHLRHDISTPSQCPRRTENLANKLGPPKEGAESDDGFTVTKDIDLLLVPVVNVGGVTTGYSFLKGVHQAGMGPPSQAFSSKGSPQGPGQFIAGRFAFDNAQRDFLMVVNSMSPHMTGIVSMRWNDAKSRDRSFFAIPKADYGPGNLPSRVLSVQCNVDYAVDNAEQPDFQFEAEDSAMSATATTVGSEHTTSTGSVPEMMATGDSSRCPLTGTEFLELDDGDEERDFANQGDADEEEPQLEEQVVPEMGDVDVGQRDAAADRWFGLEGTLGDSWGDGLEGIGTVIAPFDDPNGVIPEILHDFAGSQLNMDDMENILSDTSDILSNSYASADSALDQQAEHRTSHKRTQEMDELALSPVSNRSESPIDFTFNPTFEAADPSWIFSANGSTPDGVGIPRRPGSNDTSSGSFDMSSLLGSLAMIERSLKGRFFGPKVRKDILHPLTGELISRCTGVVRANINNVDASNLSLLRTIAAQAYYASVLSVSNDTRLIARPPGPGPFAAIQATSMNTRLPTDEPRRKQGRVEPQKRPAPAPLAPRPMVTISLPPGLPHPEVLQLPETSSPNPTLAVQSDEKSAREAKMEAKRIKNRLSAARSNQKRRAQLEAQKKELAALREQVQELQSKKTRMSEENENLKRQILSET